MGAGRRAGAPAAALPGAAPCKDRPRRMADGGSAPASREGPGSAARDPWWQRPCPASPSSARPQPIRRRCLSHDLVTPLVSQVCGLNSPCPHGLVTVNALVHKEKVAAEESC